MQPQQAGWSCSVCATDWTLRATGLDPNSDRIKTGLNLGYPHCVNSAVGLADTQCVVDVLGSYGPEAVQEWVDWERAYELCSSTAGVLNSTRWYHFVGIRGVLDGRLSIANSAEGYQGIYGTISRQQFDAWAGSWQAVYLRR
jgi:hypothetical protein